MSGITRRQVIGVAFAAPAVAGVADLAAYLKVGNTAKTARPIQRGTNGNSRLFTFVGGKLGDWSVMKTKAVVGDSLPVAEKLDVVHGPVSFLPDGAEWVLRGVTSNVRYVTLAEKDLLVAKQADLGRPEATRATLIPIRKSSAWWGSTPGRTAKDL